MRQMSYVIKNKYLEKYPFQKEFYLPLVEEEKYHVQTLYEIMEELREIWARGCELWGKLVLAFYF